MKQEKEICLKQSSSVYPIERIISAVSYLTAGLAGFVWFVIAVLIKKHIRPFLMYHIMQSIFLSIAYYLFIELYKLVFIAFAKIPLINSLVFFINGLLFSPLPIFWGLSILQVFTTTVVCYLVITSFMGLYSYIPWVSDIIKGNTGNK